MSNEAHFDENDLLALEIAAETIDECLATLDSSPRADAQPDQKFANIRVAAWTSALATDESGYLSHRIRERGIAVEEFAHVLAGLPAETQAAGWATDFQALVGSVDQVSLEAGRFSRVSEEFAFGDALWPICQRSAEILREGGPVPEAALPGFQAWLLFRLSECCAPALYGEFARFRADRTGPTSPGIYRQFCSELVEGGLRDFLRNRPPLARLTTAIARHSIEAFREFGSRLANDLAELSAMSDTTLVLKAVTPGLSDCHSGGRTVMKVAFEGDVDFYYKPRPLVFEQTWQALLGWIADRGGAETHDYPDTLSRAGHGWQRSCAQDNCEQPAAYYRRLGGQLALFRVLGSSDMHHENLIARGDTPVFIDMETLRSPMPCHDSAPNHAFRLAQRELSESVWRTGVLPDATLLPDGSVMTFGALAEQPSISGRTWGFVHVNTDEMSFALIDRPADRMANLPVTTEDARPARFLAELEHGFRDGLDLVRRNWRAFNAFCVHQQPAKNRVIFRPTAVYASALHTLRDPRRLGDGISWSSRLDFDKGDRDQLGILGDPALVAAERRALVQGDIPYFVADGLGTVFDHSGHVADRAVECVPDMRTREYPTAVEINRDINIIRWSIGSVWTADTRKWGPRPGGHADERETITAEIYRLIYIIRDRAVIGEDGAAWWGRVSLLSASSVAVLGPGLYDGLAGIAAFLSVAGASLDIPPALQLGHQALSSVSAMVERHRTSSAAPQRTIGLASGMSGIAYAAMLASDFGLARRAARWLTADIIAADRSYDLLNGAAGAIIALLELWKATGEPEWLERAIQCGDHLAEAHRRRTYWRTKQGVCSGMAHGLAGIGLALCRLGRTADRRDFSKLGIDALLTADLAYDHGAGDWASYIPGPTGSATRSTYWNRWCHGALGVGLAWREQELEEPLASADVVHRAISASLRLPTRPFDNICCGNFGHIDFLLEMSQPGLNAELAATGWERACWLAAIRKPNGYVCDNADEQAALGLFSGIAGIGYTLTRLLDPSVPSLLALQSRPVASAAALA